MNKTIAIQIGNSDDKLTQKQWACFALGIRDVVEDAIQIHFWGASLNYEPWQNLCCVCEVREGNLDNFLRRLSQIGKHYKQESVAVLVGDSQFI